MSMPVLAAGPFSRTFLRFTSGDFLVEQSCVFLFGKHYADHALLKSVCSSYHVPIRRQTHITSKGMEEWPVLVVLELIVKLMPPYDAPRACEIDQLQDERAFGLVICECECALQSAVRPFVTLRMRKVDACRHSSKDLVERERNSGGDFCLLFLS